MIERVNAPNGIDEDASYAAVCRAVRAEVLRQARLGISIPEWNDGKVVWVSPEEVFARCSETKTDIMETVGS